jgi:hypothetical protein
MGSIYAALQGHTSDVFLELKDAGLIAADENVTQVDGADAIIDLGGGRKYGNLIIDASAVEVDSGDEVYKICMMFSNSATHASGVVAGPVLFLGDAAGIAAILDAPTVPPDTDNGIGQYEMPFVNVLAGISYRYMSLSVEVSGTIASGINFTAHATELIA